MLTAWLVGAGILTAVFAAWSLFLQLQIFSKLLLAVLWVSPVVAAFVTASLSPTHKVRLGLTMAALAALLATALNWIHQMRGIDVDFPGLRGSFILFTLVLAGSAVLSILGGITGMLATRNKR
jgi:hypothetical protein